MAGKHFNIDAEKLAESVESSITMVTASQNFSDEFVTTVVNGKIMATIESSGAIVIGGGNHPTPQSDGASAIADWKNKKKGAN